MFLRFFIILLLSGLVRGATANYRILQINDSLAHIVTSLNPAQIAITSDTTGRGYKALVYKDGSGKLWYTLTDSNNAVLKNLTITGTLTGTVGGYLPLSDFADSAAKYLLLVSIKDSVGNIVKDSLNEYLLLVDAGDSIINILNDSLPYYLQKSAVGDSIAAIVRDSMDNIDTNYINGLDNYVTNHSVATNYEGYFSITDTTGLNSADTNLAANLQLLFNGLSCPEKILIKDQYLFLCDGSSALRFYDLSDLPIVNYVTATGIVAPSHMDIEGNYLASTSGVWSINLLDIKDIYNIALLSQFSLAGLSVLHYSYEPLLNGNILYVAMGHAGLWTFDITDKAVLNKTDTLDLGDIDLRRLKMSRDKKYLFANSDSTTLWVFDIYTDPSHPDTVGHFTFNIFASAGGGGMEIDGDYMFIMGNCGSALYVMDIRDPPNIDSVGTAHIIGKASGDMVKYGDILYYAAPDSGLGMINVRDIYNPLLYFLKPPAVPAPGGNEYKSIVIYKDYAIISNYGQTFYGIQLNKINFPHLTAGLISNKELHVSDKAWINNATINRVYSDDSYTRTHDIEEFQKYHPITPATSDSSCGKVFFSKIDYKLYFTGKKADASADSTWPLD